jgi:hypothetical protein
MSTYEAIKKKSGLASKNIDVTVEPKELVREGTIVMTRRDPATDIFMDNFLKFIHMGIVAVEGGEFVVYDLHPDNKNGANGCLDKKKFDDYMKGKKLIGIHHTGATSKRIQSVADRCWAGKYDKYSFNCQRFIDEVTMKEFRSDIYSYYSTTILATVGMLALTTGIIYLATRKN